ncbi:phosphopantothenoylcysteine decarboxylase subunit VHS3-like [Cynara cardunculus var. scolymus]|uniref:phosphopantothenoylcysteine decarboxylase subunit VHS3-like n=1 Tax=Cynara cardunculus var. scolymus TaxID=59895 RepID=UPI000D623BE8|nr:phosphopantothenoylcysteine decarboxylase subunit VHS3-like [Cynara cardunculus var. scolymus]
MDEVHKDISRKDDVVADLSAVKDEVQDVKSQLFVFQDVVRTNDEAIAALTSRADDALAHSLPSSSADDPCDDDLPITSAPVSSDVEDEDEDEDDEEGDSPDLPDFGSDLDDDDDDDDDDEDDFIIQYQRLATATKGVALKDSASQGEQREEDPALEANQGPKSKGKGVAQETNLKVLFKSPQPLYEDSSS